MSKSAPTPKFKPGDRVTLIGTTGPIMVVSEPLGNKIECMWFDKENRLGCGKFAPAILELVQPDPSGANEYLAVT